MEYQLKLLKIFNKEGFSKIVDLLDELMSDENNLLNFIILNINNINNIKYLTTFFKNDLDKYKDIINKIIIADNITQVHKEYFLLNLLNTYNHNNIKLLNNNILELIYANLKYNICTMNIDNVSSVILYKILNNGVYGDLSFEKMNTMDNNHSNNHSNYYEIMNYFTFICNFIIKKSEKHFLEFVFNITNIYNYRCKTFSDKELSDNILYTLLYIINNLYIKLESNNVISQFINKNIDINNLNYKDVKTYEKTNIYELLYLKLIHITIPYSITEINNNLTLIEEYNIIMDKINENELLQSFDIIQNYISSNNQKKIKKYKDLNIVIHNKLNKKTLLLIYDYYIKFILNISNKLDNNNEFLTNIVINIIDFYIFYSKKYTYLYNSKLEKYNIFLFFINIFNSKISNINLDIKLIDLFNSIFDKESLLSIVYNDKNLIDFLYNSFLFYIKLDLYEDYYKNSVKYKIIYLYNTLFSAKLSLHENLFELIDNTLTINKFLNHFIEDINNYINYFIVYYTLYLTNKDYSTLANTYYIYIEEHIRFFRYFLSTHINNIEDDIIEISIDKFINNFIRLNKICTRKNNVYKITLYLIDIFLIFNDTKYLDYFKNKSVFYNFNTFENIIKDLNNIYKHTNITKLNSLNQSINNIEITQIKEYEDIPEDFLDPIYNTLIMNPVLLPSSNKIVDYNVIKKHLLYHSFDPFNREYLTLELLNTYNLKDSTRKITSELKKKITQWIDLQEV